MDITILEDLGLTSGEIKVYMALLELGNSTAGPLLEKSGLQNSVVHRALNTLIEKGLISFITEGKRKIYQATDPENFYTFIDDKKKRFENEIKDLECKIKERQQAIEKQTLKLKDLKTIDEELKSLETRQNENNEYLEKVVKKIERNKIYINRIQ